MKTIAKKSKKTEQKSGDIPSVEMKTASMVANPKHAWALNRIVILDDRLGKDKGAMKERARLNLILSS